MKFFIASPDQFPAIAQQIITQCERPETHCIQSATGESADSLVEEMQKWHEEDEMRWVIAKENDQLIGVMGAEYERPSGRAWLRGPFALRHWPQVADGLWKLLEKSLPDEITRFDSFLNAANVQGQAFYAAAGFAERHRAHVYSVTADRFRHIDRTKIAQTPVRLISPADYAGFSAIHDKVFANTFIQGSQIVEKMDDDHRVWVQVDGDQVRGYLYGVQESWADDGYVEFLGVDESERGRGIGGALLLKALDWFFAERNLPAVGLTVDDENVNARTLYERVGFRLRYTGVNQRLEK